MIARYSEAVKKIQTLPKLWLLSDERNDARLEWALATLPKGSAFVFRHYHLQEQQRRTRYDELAAIARAADHLVILSGSEDLASEWGADGIYAPPTKLGVKRQLVRLATVHDAREIHQANRVKADAVFLSPAFPTRSHKNGGWLGVALFKQLAKRAEMPVIALGGMTHERARELDWSRWGAIDGLS